MSAHGGARSVATSESRWSTWRRAGARVPRVADRARERLVGPAAQPVAARSPALAYVLSVAVVVLYPFHQLLTRRQMVAEGAMWAEMATNYYASSLEGSVLSRLVATDAGYIPLPQRVVAVIGAEGGLPASAVPYFYSGVAVVGTGVLVATAVLPVFRRVIASDWLRFAVAVAILLIPDFETRTFINFTYLAVVPFAMMTALALVGREQPVPAWAWALPPLMLSKPAVLTVLPMMVVAAVVSGRRFRFVTVASVALGLVQLARLAVSSSAPNGTPLQESDASLPATLWTGLRYAASYLARMLFEPDGLSGTGTVLTVLLLVALVGLVVLGVRGPGVALVLVGVSLALFATMLTTVSYAATFTPDLAMLAEPISHRRFVVASIGSVLVVAGCVALVTESLRRRGGVAGALQGPDGVVPAAKPVRTAGAAVRTAAGVALFIGWFVGSGWADYTARLNGPTAPTTVGNSRWAEQARALDTPGAPVCVPLDPLGWFYGRDCVVLDMGSAVGLRSLPVGTDGLVPPDEGAAEADGRTGASSTLRVSAPATVAERELASLALLVVPEHGDADVTASAELVLADGSTRTLYAHDEVAAAGELLQFGDEPLTFVGAVRSVKFRFDVPVTLAASGPDEAASPFVMWMGR